MINEAKIENIRRFVRAYGELAACIDRVDDLQHQIVLSLKAASESEPDFNMVGSILGRHLSKAETITRKTAWLSQHLLASRALCVGNHVIQRTGDELASPILAQLERLGYNAKAVPFKHIRGVLASSGGYSKRIDACVVDPEEAKITVVKGCTLGSLKLDRDGTGAQPTLWTPGDSPSRRWLARSETVRTLVLAEFVLRSAFPAYDVETVLMAVDPGEDCWGHMGYRLTGTALAEIDRVDGMFPLHEARLVWDHLNSDADYAVLADIPTAQPLNKLPGDRAARVRMILDFMWSHQAAAEGIAAFDVSQIAGAVEKRHLLHYTRDWRRHDIEDCLVSGGFVERPRYESKCYVLTPLGVYEALAGRIALNPACKLAHSKDVCSHVLSSIRRQARLLARYAEGEQVINRIVKGGK